MRGTFKAKLHAPRRVRLFKSTLRSTGFFLAVFMDPSPAVHADTLEEALVSAYRNNPTLAAQRADLRVVDEEVPIARSAGLPQVALSSSITNDIYRREQVGFNNPSRRFDAGLNFSVPLFSGGAVTNSVNAAETRVLAGRADLRNIESQIFTEVVAAYMNVIRDEFIVGLNRRNVEILKINFQATEDRFQFGDLTLTDVAQSEARLALSQGDLENAEAQLIVSRENYIRVVGKPPVDLMPPPPLPPPPPSIENVVEVALLENPILESIKYASLASDFDINVARASRLPRISVFANGDAVDFSSVGQESVSALSRNSRSAIAGLTLSVPIFQGGLAGAQIRQAQARYGRILELSVEAERTVIAEARSAYARWRAAERIIQSSNIAVQASALSLEGVRAENGVGTRTILDILDAEQELLDSQVRLISARRDEYVATFAVLASMGRAEAEDLGLENGVRYDPSLNYESVEGEIWDWSTNPNPTAESLSTNTTVAQTANLSRSSPSPSN